jgi:hypothetical protein
MGVDWDPDYDAWQVVDEEGLHAMQANEPYRQLATARNPEGAELAAKKLNEEGHELPLHVLFGDCHIESLICGTYGTTEPTFLTLGKARDRGVRR